MWMPCSVSEEDGRFLFWLALRSPCGCEGCHLP